MKTIEIDEQTAELLEARAAARGLSIGEVIAELVAFIDSGTSVEPGELAELEQQWKAIEAGEPTVPHEKVARWLETWGTSDFKSWHKR